MSTPDVGDALEPAGVGGSGPAGAFIPDPGAIERLANAFFKGLTSGAPLGTPAIPASPPAPWSTPAPPSASVAASAIPVQPPFGAPDVPTNGLPSSVPFRSFGGASAGSASPFAFPQSRGVAPAASQTAIAAPRVDPLASLGALQLQDGTGVAAPVAMPSGAPLGAPAIPASSSAPWSTPAPPSTSVAAGAIPAQPPFGAPDIPTNSPPSSVPFRSFGGASAGSASPFAFPQSRAVAPAASQTAIAAARPDPLASPWALPLQDAKGVADTAATAPSAPLSPFAAPIDLSAALNALHIAVRPAAAAAATEQAYPLAAAETNSAYSLPGEARGEPFTPSAAAAAAPSGAISPVFADASPGPGAFDTATIRNDFPILQERVHGKRLIWLDNGATTQKPQAVIDRLAYFYAHENSNVHRGAHTLAARATDAYEAARDKVRRFLGASSTREIVFVRGATEGINLVAQSWGRRNVRAGDEIVVTWLEHHANIVPWQQLCLEKGARLRVAPVDDNGDILLDEYEKLLGPRTRIVALPLVSNALGTVTPAYEMVAAAHRHGALALVDGAQSVSHRRTDVQALDADFFVLSGHKMFAPTGIGAVYAKQAILETMPPWQGGGNMIADVTFERTVYQGPPDRFEAGTGNIADAVGLGAAIDYLDAVGMEAIALHEHGLIEETVAGLGSIPGLRLVGAPRERAGVVSFVLDGCRTEDVGRALDREGIAVRAGHHCAQPILRRFGLESTVRPSFALYNTPEDVEALIVAVRRIALQAQGGSR
jgi:cysteine desulfurase/selenocysteine lyase